MAVQKVVCKRCVMDTSDPEIDFDSKGICNHCNNWDTNLSRFYKPAGGETELNKIVEKIKRESRKNKYDAIIGLSGGIDSSYLAYVMSKKFGLRLLAVHVDGGWNSEASVFNIEKITRELNIDLFTHVVNWQSMKKLQLAYLKSGIANQDVPQDHAFFVALYRYAVRNKIKYVLNGSNLATEGILPKSWGYRAMDSKSLKSIFKKHGKGKLFDYPTVGFLRYYFYYRIVKGMKVIKPLNFIPYNKKEALRELIVQLGYKEYGGKHHESRFTKWFQTYYLVKKFGFDKRLAHLSSMINSGLISREEALSELKEQSFKQNEIVTDSKFIAKKLDINLEQLNEFINVPNRSFKDYKSNDFLYRFYFNYIKK